MNDISPIGPGKISGYQQSAVNRPTDVPEAGSSRAKDDVQLSEISRFLGKLSELPDVREDLIAEVKSEIEAGTYDTEAKVDAMLDELIADLV